MLGHRVDACASHVMLCASCGCFLITLDALRIVLDVFCIVCDAWASFDACASCVEPGAPWVTEASSFAVFFFRFSLLCSIWYYHFTQVCISLDFAGYNLISHELDFGCDGCVDFLCCAIDSCRFYPPLTVVGTVFIAMLIKLLRVV